MRDRLIIVLLGVLLGLALKFVLGDVTPSQPATPAKVISDRATGGSR